MTFFQRIATFGCTAERSCWKEAETLVCRYSLGNFESVRRTAAKCCRYPSSMRIPTADLVGEVFDPEDVGEALELLDRRIPGRDAVRVGSAFELTGPMIRPKEHLPLHGTRAPTPLTPRHRPRSVRRTTTVDVEYPEGLDGPLILTGRGCNLCTHLNDTLRGLEDLTHLSALLHRPDARATLAKEGT